MGPTVGAALAMPAARPSLAVSPSTHQQHVVDCADFSCTPQMKTPALTLRWLAAAGAIAVNMLHALSMAMCTPGVP